MFTLCKAHSALLFTLYMLEIVHDKTKNKFKKNLKPALKFITLEAIHFPGLMP